VAVTYDYRDNTGVAFTGTSANSLIGGTLPEIPTDALDIVTEPLMRFTVTGAAAYLNNAGSRSINLDLLAGGEVIHRTNLSSIAANANPRSVLFEHSIVVTAEDTCMVTCQASVSATGSGDTDFNTGAGNDTRFCSTVVYDQPFDTTGPIELDVQASISTTSNIATHAFTPLYVEVAKANAGSGSGGTTIIVDGGEVHPVDSEAEMLALSAVEGDFAVRSDQDNATYILSAEPASTLSNWLLLGGGGGSVPYESQIMYSCIWTGSAYEARPNVFRPVIYQGPVQPNAFNSPGGPFAADPWDDTSGA
jgi:hypothetical protein